MKNDLKWQDLRDLVVVEAVKNKLRPLTKNQGEYIKAMEEATVVVCNGPAGSGKTYISCGLAVRLLREGKIKHIVMTRPLVSCGRGFGYLPGDLSEKTAPFTRPLMDVLMEFVSESEANEYFKAGKIEFLPLDVMRGLSIHESFIICDESENADWMQLRMLVNRLGKNSKLVISGDVTQCDLEFAVNPFGELIRRFAGHPEIRLVSLTRQDIVRNPLIAWMDDKLAAPFSPQEKKPRASMDWDKILCPRCGADAWFLRKNQRVEVVRCWSCRKMVDLYDKHWRWSPCVLKDDAGITPVSTRPVPEERT